MVKKLNIGCGKDILKGYVNLDIVKLPGVDVVHDLEKTPYPFKDNEFDEIVAHQILEHISDLSKVMAELSRILKKGGRLKLDVPHFTSNTSFMDPTHKRLFAYSTFDYFVKGTFATKNYEYPTHFSKTKKRLRFYKGIHFYNHLIEPIVNRLLKIGNGHVYEGTVLRNLFPAWKLEVILVK